MARVMRRTDPAYVTPPTLYDPQASRSQPGRYRAVCRSQKHRLDAHNTLGRQNRRVISLRSLDGRTEAWIYEHSAGYSTNEPFWLQDDVVAMTRAGVDEGVIINHVRMNGPSHPLQTADIIHLQQSGVSPRVIQALQQPPGRGT